MPILLTYVLSFVFLGIYWNNHHHLLQATEHVNGRILWANLHLLFWLSLTPFAMGWMGENTAAAVPTAAYGTVLLGSAIAYWILQREILAAHGPHFRLRAALGRDLKGNISPVLYIVGIAVAFENPRISDAIYVFVALMWLVPDRRIERSGLGRGEARVDRLTSGSGLQLPCYAGVMLTFWRKKLSGSYFFFRSRSFARFDPYETPAGSTASASR